MAKPTKKSRTGSGAGRSPADPVDVMLTLVAETGWRNLTLDRIAKASGITLAQLYREYGSRNDLLVAFSRRIDAAMLSAVGEADPGTETDRDTMRDRLFEAIMARLDALTPHKAAIRVLARELPADPLALACFLYGGMRRGIDWTLAAAGLDRAGLASLVRRKVLGLVYLDTLRIWLKDDSADLGPTMARLDQRLRNAMVLLGGPEFISQMRKGHP